MIGNAHKPSEKNGKTYITGVVESKLVVICLSGCTNSSSLFMYLRKYADVAFIEESIF